MWLALSADKVEEFEYPDCDRGPIWQLYLDPTTPTVRQLPEQEICRWQLAYGNKLPAKLSNKVENEDGEGVGRLRAPEQPWKMLIL